MYKTYSEAGKMLDVGDIGLVEVQPFKNYPDSKWHQERWTMRLLNAGDLEEVHRIVRSYMDNTRDDELQKRKIEMFIRSVVSRNGVSLVSDEALEAYQRDTGESISKLELARKESKTLEQFVLNVWNEQYLILMNKQQNYIQGLVVCQNCGATMNASEEGLPPVSNIDEVNFCNYCPDREKQIDEITKKLEEDKKQQMTGSLLDENEKPDLGEKYMYIYKFSQPHYENAIFSSELPVVAVQPFKYLKHSPVQDFTIPMGLFVGDDDIIKKRTSNVMSLLENATGMPMGDCSIILLKFLKYHYFLLKYEWWQQTKCIRDIVDTSQSDIVWECYKHEGRSVLKAEQLNDVQKLWIYMCSLKEKKEQRTSEFNMFEYLSGFVNPELYSQIKKAKDGTGSRENASYNEMHEALLHGDLDTIEQI